MRPPQAGLAVLAAVLPLTACMATAVPEGAERVASAPAAGTLRMDDITVEFVVDLVQIRITPLDPGILSLTAPDTRRRLESVPSGDDATAFLVSVFTEEAGGAEFEPRGISLENRGRVYRPTAIRPLTPGWGTRLQQRRAEQAVYLFATDVDLELPLVMEVGGVRSDAWATILARLDVERARLRARGGQASRSNFRIFR